MIRILSQSTHGRLPDNQMPLVEGIYSIKASKAPDKWFVIFTDPQYERRVSQALVARAISHYLPRARRWKRQSRRAKHQREPKRHVTSPLLTRYVFAAMPADELHFGRITDLDGVHSILSDSAGPIFVPEDRVLEIARREEAGEFDDTNRMSCRPAGARRRCPCRDGSMSAPGLSCAPVRSPDSPARSRRSSRARR